MQIKEQLAQCTIEVLIVSESQNRQTDKINYLRLERAISFAIVKVRHNTKLNWFCQAELRFNKLKTDDQFYLKIYEKKVSFLSLVFMGKLKNGFQKILLFTL